MTKAKSKVSNENKIIVVMAILIIAILIGVNARTIYSIDKVEKEIDAQMDLYRKEEAKLNEYIRLANFREELELSRELLYKQIPMGANENGIKSFINYATQLYGLTIIDLNIDSSKSEAKDVKEIPISLSIKGSYLSITRLINSLQVGERLYKIEEIELSRESGQSKDLYSNIYFIAYYK